MNIKKMKPIHYGIIIVLIIAIAGYFMWQKAEDKKGMEDARSSYERWKTALKTGQFGFGQDSSPEDLHQGILFQMRQQGKIPIKYINRL